MAKKGSGTKGKAPAIKLLATKRFVGSEGQRAICTLMEGPASETVAFRVDSGEKTEAGHTKFTTVYRNKVEKGSGEKALDAAVREAVKAGWQLTQGRSRAMGPSGEIPEA